MPLKKRLRQAAGESTTIIGITTILTGGVLAAIWAYVTKR